MSAAVYNTGQCVMKGDVVQYLGLTFEVDILYFDKEIVHIHQDGYLGGRVPTNLLTFVKRNDEVAVLLQAGLCVRCKGTGSHERGGVGGGGDYPSDLVTCGECHGTGKSKKESFHG
jgi:hypothetical protein